MSFKDVEVSAGNGDFFRPVDGANKVRVVSDPLHVWVSFNRTDKSVKKFCTVESANEFNKTAQKEEQAKKRWCVWLIDRADGKIKIGEFGAAIVSQLKTMEHNPDYAYDGLCPYDITITKSGAGLDTEYSVVAARQNTALTAEEQAEVAALEPLALVMRDDFVDADKLPPNFLA